MTNEERAQLIRGMKDCADWLESHPDIPVYSVVVTSMPNGRKEFAAVARSMGKAEKRFSDEFAHLYKRFGPVLFDAFEYRRLVCERVVTGTQTLQAEPERIIPALPEREIEVVEWKCGSILEDSEQEAK